MEIILANVRVLAQKDERDSGYEPASRSKSKHATNMSESTPVILSDAAIVNISPKFIDRFWSHVRKTHTCWFWEKATCNGYGRFRAETATVGTHRLSYFLFYGKLPERHLHVLHHCDVPRCVNPNHLYAGTDADNARDRVERGRSAKGEQHGLRLHPECAARGERHGLNTHPEIRRYGHHAGAKKYHERIAEKYRTAPRVYLEFLPWGEDNHASKLTKEKVLEIRALYAGGSVTQMQLTEMFNVGQSCISSVLLRKTWPRV